MILWAEEKIYEIFIMLSLRSDHMCEHENIFLENINLQNLIASECHGDTNLPELTAPSGRLVNF